MIEGGIEAEDSVNVGRIEWASAARILGWVAGLSLLIGTLIRAVLNSLRKNSGSYNQICMVHSPGLAGTGTMESYRVDDLFG